MKGVCQDCAGMTSPPFPALAALTVSPLTFTRKGVSGWGWRNGLFLDEFVWTKERFLFSCISIASLPVNGAVFPQATSLDHSTALAAGTRSISGGAAPPGSPGSRCPSWPLRELHARTCVCGRASGLIVCSYKLLQVVCTRALYGKLDWRKWLRKG